MTAALPLHSQLVNSTEGTLTNYKKVVDKHQKNQYGLSKSDLRLAEKKLKDQKEFLTFSYLYDRINKNSIPLSELIISANHSPNRYYSEIQNRVNTLTKVAKQIELKPLFMTITLPSEFHKYKKKGKTLVKNPKYNGVTPKDSVKVLTKMFAKLRQDRSLKELSKEQRVYFRVNEPHKNGTPHTHILMYVPADRVDRVKKAFKRLFNEKSNDIQDDINNSTSYIMKYINKTLPLSKNKKLSEQEKYLNAWYVKHKIVRFNSSRTLAPLSLYRMLHSRYSLFVLTELLYAGHLSIYSELDSNKVVQIIDEFGDTVYTRSSNFDVILRGNYFPNNSQPNDSAVGVA